MYMCVYQYILQINNQCIRLQKKLDKRYIKEKKKIQVIKYMKKYSILLLIKETENKIPLFTYQYGTALIKE